MKIEGGYLIGRIKLLSGRVLNRLLQEQGLTEFNGEQGKILYSLWKKDGLSISQLADNTGLAMNSLSNMLKYMEKQGLLQRKACARDKRKKLIFLSEKGRSLEDKTIAINKEMSEIFYKGFRADEIEACEQALYRIAANFTEVDT